MRFRRNLVPIALFPGFGGEAGKGKGLSLLTSKAREKRAGDEVVLGGNFWSRNFCGFVGKTLVLCGGGGEGVNFCSCFVHPRHLKYGLPLWDLSALGGGTAGYGSPGNRLNANMLQILAA